MRDSARASAARAARQGDRDLVRSLTDTVDEKVREVLEG
jgi:hypothetical protein